MRKLDQKLVRDLLQMKGQAIAIVGVIAAGIAVFVMSMCCWSALKHGQRTFYRDFRFADVFSNARRCPRSVGDRIGEIDGVSAVEMRLVYNVLLKVRGMDEPATAKLISIPQAGQSRLNQVYVSQGRMLEPGRTGEVVVSAMFAEAHRFVPGDQVDAIINGRLQSLTVVGIALCPEYVIQIQGGNMLPDKNRFGIFWMNQRELESAFDMTDAFNSVSLKLTYGANRQHVIDQMDHLLEPYGSLGAYDRSDNQSHQFVEDELLQLRTMATIAPVIFMSVAAFLLNIVVTRIVARQREQIAALKAFGYSNFEVGGHYLDLVLAIATAGMALGTVGGIWMATNLIEMYQEFYKFPVLTLKINHFAVFAALLLTTTIAVLGTWFAVAKAIRLPPAEAMRPETPPTFRLTWIEKILPTRWLPAALPMVVRNVQRKPFKSTASVVGISMAVAVLIVGSFSLDSLDYLIDFQFRKSQRQDITVGFVEPVTSSVVYEVDSLDGVLASETMRSVGARIHFAHRFRRIGVTGLVDDPQLFRLIDAHERPVSVPAHGIMLNSMLVKILGCRKGDIVKLEVLEGKRPVLDLEVTAIVDEYGGINAYISKEGLHRALNESAVASGAFLKVDANRLSALYRELELRPGVSTVSIKDAAIVSFKETIAENMMTMRSFNILFAVVIAIGVVYNSARISLSEQSRDLATMRVIGFTRGEVSAVLLGEIALFTCLALPLGCLSGYGLAWAMIQGLATENFRIPLIVDPSTFLFASLVVVGATVASGWIVQRRIGNLDLIAALKTRE